MNPSNSQEVNNSNPNSDSDALLKKMFDDITPTSKGVPPLDQEDIDTKFSLIEDNQDGNPVHLDSSKILIGGKPLVRRQLRAIGIVLDQNTENPSQAFKDIQTSIENSPDGDQGIVFLKEIAKALSGYISRILQTNEIIVGSTGVKYINTDVASYILAYLDKENFKGTNTNISITNNIFFLQANVLLLEKIKQKLIKAEKIQVWKMILSELQASCKL